MYDYHVCAHRGQKRASNALELESRTAVSRSVVLGSQTLWRSAGTLTCSDIPPASVTSFEVFSLLSLCVYAHHLCMYGLVHPVTRVEFRTLFKGDNLRFDLESNSDHQNVVASTSPTEPPHQHK